MINIYDGAGAHLQPDEWLAFQERYAKAVFCSAEIMFLSVKPAQKKQQNLIMVTAAF